MDQNEAKRFLTAVHEEQYDAHPHAGSLNGFVFAPKPGHVFAGQTKIERLSDRRYWRLIDVHGA